MNRLFIVVCFLSGPVVVAQRTWDTIPNLPQHYVERCEQFKKEPVVTGKTMFLGNSITEGGDWKRLLKDSTVINRGIGGDITFGVLNRLDEVIKRKPSKIFVLIGINDLSKGIPEEVILENIFTMVRRLKAGSPKTAIFIQSILPLNKTFKNFPPRYDQDEHVVSINGQLKKIAARFGYTFVDLYSEFRDTEGKLDAKYSTDGLHLGSAGYLHWVEILKKQKHL